MGGQTRQRRRSSDVQRAAPRPAPRLDLHGGRGNRAMAPAAASPTVDTPMLDTAAGGFTETAAAAGPGKKRGDRYATSPPDCDALRGADRDVWKAHPELNGRKLGRGKRDAKLRKEWMDHYIQRGGPTSKQDPKLASGALDKQCPPPRKASGKGRLGVQVVTTRGQPIEDATVHLEGAGGRRDAVSSRSGQVEYVGWTAGDYTVSASKELYEPGKATVAIQADQTALVKVVLAVDVHRIAEEQRRLAKKGTETHDKRRALQAQLVDAEKAADQRGLTFWENVRKVLGDFVDGLGNDPTDAKQDIRQRVRARDRAAERASQLRYEIDEAGKELKRIEARSKQLARVKGGAGDDPAGLDAPRQSTP